MRNKFIPLIVALVFGSVAVVGFSKMMQASPGVATSEIYVAVRNLASGEAISQDAIQLEHWPQGHIPTDAVRDWTELEGKFTKLEVFEGEPLLARKLDDTNDNLSVNIPQGYNVLALRPEEVASVANLVSPGDRVNVIGFFNRSELIPETTTKKVLKGVRVFAVDGRTDRRQVSEEGDTKSAKAVSLLIHEDDAEVLQWARELSRISLMLSRPEEGEQDKSQEGPNPAGQELLAWLASIKEAAPAVEEPGPDYQVAEVEQPEIEHRMMKIGDNGQISVYSWEEGNPVPKVVGGKSTKAASADEKAGLDFLTGSGSPLFDEPAQPPKQVQTPPQSSSGSPAGNPAEGE